MSNMKVVSRDNPIPLYFQVSQIIENEIKEGTYKPGDLFYFVLLNNAKKTNTRRE